MPGKTGGSPAPAKIDEPLQMVLVLKPVVEKEAVTRERKGDVNSNSEKPDDKDANIVSPARFQAQPKAGMAEIKSKAEALSVGKLEKSYKAEEKVPDYEEALLLNIKEHIKSAGGSILKTDINKETGQPEYLLIEISGQEYQKLIEKLGEFGKIQMPPDGDVGQSNQPVQVRLHILINK
jgi:hypothetical protein